MEEIVLTELPETEDVGKVAKWELLNNEEEVVVAATFLGLGSSRRPSHEHVEEFVRRGEWCGRCRWLEIRIFRLDDARYLTAYTRATEVPGETDTQWLKTSETADDLLHTLFQKGKTSLPAREAIGTAAQHDVELRDAWLNSRASGRRRY